MSSSVSTACAPTSIYYAAFTLAKGDRVDRQCPRDYRSPVSSADPGVFTILGVSNVSFGLDPAARYVLNSVFLHHCVEAGLDAAIVNPAHITPYAEISAEQRALADDLVFNKRLDALQRFIEGFATAAEDARAEKEDPTIG